MKLTTPVTASAPYTADAPPVSTSTDLINLTGIEPTSTAAEPADPPTWRRPLTKVRVRFAPKPRKFRMFAPSEKLAESIELSAVVDENRAGISLITSVTENSPDSWISSSEIAWTGDGEARLGSRAIRDPVTTTFSTSSSFISASSCACTTLAFNDNADATAQASAVTW